MTDAGTYLRYIDRNFNEESLRLLGVANAVIAEYEAQGLDLTLRQLYYQMVSRDVVPNSDRSYNRLKSLIGDGRLAGLVSWTAIEDRGRGLRGLGHQESPAQAVRHLAAAYRRDLWEDQEWRPEVWIEKDALVGVISGICNELRVNFFSCRGYSSLSEQWRAGQRFQSYLRKGQRPIVFHLGDHDPSGRDMTSKNREQLELFTGVPVVVQRLALNMPQIEELKPPPNPAKLTDSRIEGYQEYMRSSGYEHLADSSWELDALSPTYIRDLINKAVTAIRHEEVWADSLGREANEVQSLRDFAATMSGGEPEGEEEE